MIRRAALIALLTAALVTGCVRTPDVVPSPSATPTPTTTPTVAPTATATPSPTGSPTAEPTATPRPLALEPPAERDERRVRVEVNSDLPIDADGTITVTVESLADEMITELVLRWPADLHATLFPAPFRPSDERIREGGQPLIQAWTKWVLGPGERGEPAGTVSLGYGPLPAGGSLDIPLFVTRRAEGRVAFDLQVLAGEALLTLDDGEPALLRVEVP